MLHFGNWGKNLLILKVTYALCAILVACLAGRGFLSQRQIVRDYSFEPAQVRRGMNALSTAQAMLFISFRAASLRKPQLDMSYKSVGLNPSEPAVAVPAPEMLKVPTSSASNYLVAFSLSHPQSSFLYQLKADELPSELCYNSGRGKLYYLVNEEELRLRELRADSEEKIIPLRRGAQGLRLTPDRKELTVCQGGDRPGVWIFSADHEERDAFVATPWVPTSALLLQNRLLVANETGGLTSFDRVSKRPLTSQTLDRGPLELNWQADRSEIWVCCFEGRCLKVLRNSDLQPLRTLPLREKPASIAFNPNRQTMAVCSDSEIAILEQQSGKLRGTISLQSIPTALTYGPDQRSLYVLSKLYDGLSCFDEESLQLSKYSPQGIRSRPAAFNLSEI